MSQVRECIPHFGLGLRNDPKIGWHKVGLFPQLAMAISDAVIFSVAF